MILKNKTILSVLIILILAVQPAFSQSSTSSPTTTATTGAVTSPAPVTPAITKEEANAQALAETPPPQHVFDLANSGVVYGLLSEGVSAWIASLGGNTDQWGNERSSVYQSATRPDVVPASLQTFLLAFYKDNPTIGLAYGPEGIKEAETALDKHFNEVLSGRADEIYNTAVEEAEAAAQAEAEAQQQEQEAADETTTPDVNDSENVPPLDDNSDNGEDPEPDEVDNSPATITSISPSDFDITSTPQKLDITGTGFGTDASAVTIDLSNGITGLVPDSVSDTSLTVTLPDRFEAGTDIAISINKNDEVTSGVTITARPTVESLSRTQFIPSSSLAIYGYGFKAGTTSATTILFEATTDGREDFELTPDNVDFLASSLKSQIRIDSMKVTADTTGTYNLIVISNGEQASGTNAVELIIE